MPDILPVQLIPPTFVEGYCPENIQAFANDLMSGTTVQGGVTLDTTIISETAPTDHSKLWFKLDGSLNPFSVPGGVPLFKWSPVYAAWVLRHPALASVTHRWEEFANLAAIDTYEGGSAGAITATTGPFWALDTNYNGRSPMSPGAINGSSPAKTLGYQENYGDGSKALTNLEIPKHTHFISSPTNEGNNIPTDNSNYLQDGGGVGGGNENYVLTRSTVEASQAKTSSYGTDPITPLQLVHPVRGMACIVRTARIFILG
jgi:hypothetical protein